MSLLSLEAEGMVAAVAADDVSDEEETSMAAAVAVVFSVDEGSTSFSLSSIVSGF